MHASGKKLILDMLIPLLLIQQKLKINTFDERLLFYIKTKLSNDKSSHFTSSLVIHSSKYSIHLTLQKMRILQIVFFINVPAVGQFSEHH